MFDKIDLQIVYKKNGKRSSVRLYDGGNDDLGFALNKDAERLSIELIPEGELQIESAVLTTDYSYVPHYRVYLGDKFAGASRESSVYGQSKKQFLRYINKVSPKKVPLKKLVSYSYTYIRDRKVYTLIGSMDDRLTFTEFQHCTDKQRLEVIRKFSSLTISASTQVFDLYFKRGGYDEVFDGYAKALVPEYKAQKYLVGFNLKGDGKKPITDSDIDNSLKMVNDFGSRFDTFILEGYYSTIGDWNDLNPDCFTRDLHQIADCIAEHGLKAGIEIKPFTVDPKSRAATENRRMLEKDILGRPLLKKGMFHYDIDNSETVLYISDLFKSLVAAGFEVFKVGGLQSYITGRDEARKAYAAAELLRGLTKDCVLILCNAPILASAGRTDYCGIAGHVVNNWDGNWFKRLFSRKGNRSTLNAIMNTMARRHLDGRVFRNYPSRLSFLQSDSKFTKDQKEIMVKISQLFGGSLLLTDNLYNYDKATKAVLEQLFAERHTKVTRVISPLKNVTQIEYLDNGQQRIFTFNTKKGKIINSI